MKTYSILFILIAIMHSITLVNLALFEGEWNVIALFLSNVLFITACVYFGIESRASMNGGIKRVSHSDCPPFMYTLKSNLCAEVYEKAMHAQINFIDKIIDSFNSNLENSNWQDSSFSLIKIKEEDYDNVDNKIYLLKEIIYKELSYTHSEEI